MDACKPLVASQKGGGAHARSPRNIPTNEPWVHTLGTDRYRRGGGVAWDAPPRRPTAAALFLDVTGP